MIRARLAMFLVLGLALVGCGGRQYSVMSFVTSIQDNASSGICADFYVPKRTSSELEGKIFNDLTKIATVSTRGQKQGVCDSTDAVGICWNARGGGAFGSIPSDTKQSVATNIVVDKTSKFNKTSCQSIDGNWESR